MKNSEDWPKAEVISIRQVFPLVAPSLRITHSFKFVIFSKDLDIQTFVLGQGGDAILCSLC